MSILKHVGQLSLFLCCAFCYTAQSAPAAPTLYSPLGMLSAQPPVFEWGESFGANWYRVWVKDETGVVIADWVRSTDTCNTVVDGICTYSPMVNTVGVTVWLVRGYDGELGEWSARGKFFDSLSPPSSTTLLEPVSSTSESTPIFSWTLIPEATWYKIQIIDQFEQLIANQWLRADSTNVDCNTGTGICSKTPMVILPPGDFEWRVRTYNSAGLGPWTPPEFVTFIPGSPLSAIPNPVQVGDCDFDVIFEIMVTNDSNDTVTGIDVLPTEGSFILVDSDASSAMECEDEITTLLPGESCTITREYFGDTAIPDANVIPVTGDNITRLDIDVEIDYCF